MSADSVYSLASKAFPSYDNGTRIDLYNVLIAFETATHPAIFVNIIVSILGVATTSIHVYILSRKSMLKSSVTSIMIGVGVCDFMALLSSIVFNIFYLLIEKNEKPCDPPLPLPSFYAYWIAVVIYDLFRRSSTWLSVLMALIRWIVMKFGTRRTFRKVTLVSFGAYVVLGTVLAGFPISGLYYFRYDIVKVKDWVPWENCTGAPVNVTYVIYTLVQSTLYTVNDGIIEKIFQLVNGIVSKVG
ncbi:hypothetical protein CRE_11409 [Caenorhabditis remanei]|uniref:G-protein coupled receptors family 1 profile domain-containing protein n=1 Tax=Caenorhabditis remanei TaxID=31234 RepID=E3N750_CAERE|nr:hypothetical protein CRE_11409 [Caenorhabditis remanei]